MSFCFLPVLPRIPGLASQASYYFILFFANGEQKSKNTLVKMDTHYAQIVIGAPGAGKSTYCDGMQLFLSAIGRPVAVVNLDPANHTTSYPCAVDIRHLITVEDAMEKHNLGPNGGSL